MKLTSDLYQSPRNSERNHASSQTKPDNPKLLFDAWSGPQEPPIGCLHFFFSAGRRLGITNLGENKANVKRKVHAMPNTETRTISFQCGTAIVEHHQSSRAVK